MSENARAIAEVIMDRQVDLTGCDHRQLMLGYIESCIDALLIAQRLQLEDEFRRTISCEYCAPKSFDR